MRASHSLIFLTGLILSTFTASAQNGEKVYNWIYFAYSHNPKNTVDKTSPAMTKLVRGRIKDYQWVDQETLFEAPDSILVSGGTRWGSRLLFYTDGYLYFTTGDMQQSIAVGINPQWKCISKMDQ
ncbi:PQQ-dependent sugar dehydrogenase [Algoriphagus sp.]|uniref:PQQ-dependent sugar dehydrogenase n=1 Tax=Algoriphagus sp. TaxID=1872435 RepID=UPI00391E0097